MLITGPSEEDIASLKHYLDGMFTIKDLGYAKYFIGLEIAQTAGGTYLNQHKYVLDLLTDAGF